MKAKNTLIFPRTDADLIKAKHFLVSRNRPYQTVYIPVMDGSGRKEPMIMTEMDLIERGVYRFVFGSKKDPINVFM